MSYTKKLIAFFIILVIADFLCILAIKLLFNDDTYTYIAIGTVTALVFIFAPKKTIEKQ